MSDENPAGQIEQKSLFEPILPLWLRLWLPLSLLCIIVPTKILSPETYSRVIDGELGLIELATPVWALLGFLWGVKIMMLFSWRSWPLLWWWVATISVCCFYFAGEELSWGQHIFQWSTPDYLIKLNDQQETNFHNISSWFDQKPRLLLELFVLFGGVIVPCFFSAKIVVSKHRQLKWFWPTRDCLVTAALAIVIRLPERVKDILDLETIPFEIRYSEPQEYYFAMFLMIYMMSLFYRVKGSIRI